MNNLLPLFPTTDSNQDLNVAVQAFKLTNPINSRKSKLFRFAAQIRELRDSGFSYAKVAEFVTAQGLETTGNAVRQFAERNLKNGQTT